MATLPSSLRRRVIEKVNANKLTIIVGPTGCGKSSIVPQILLDDIGSPILVTQPRRLAVVAVATYVAKQRGVVLGEDEVGYHVGQDRLATHDTQLVFSTAGVLLEELKAHGLKALTQYKVVVIDECHERSCESDLVLTIIKEFMIAHPRTNLRLVLMSATFNHKQYSSFFSRVPGCEYVDTIPIQTANNLDAHYDRVETLYLEQMVRLLGRSQHVDKEDYIDYCLDMKEESNLDDISAEGKTLTEELLSFILALVTHLDSEESMESIFLIFAPTYRHLEQLYNYLGCSTNFDLGVLHSSIDVEDCMLSMNSGTASRRKRKILLASAIADSSITIPNVGCVIDTCRSLEMRWNRSKSRYDTKTVWASQAICDQRKGRTGRTCSGTVFRLVYQSFYNNHMDKFEQPKLCKASCRDEICSLLASKNKVMNDPQILLKKCLDPPDTANVTEAIEYLKRVGACREVIISRKRKLVLTEHGELMVKLPFTVDEANTVVYGAKQGWLHETLALVAIKSSKPMPILTAFGDDEANRLNLSRYFPNVELKEQHSVAVANLAAYIHWYMHWNNIRRHEIKDHFKNCTLARSGEGVSSHFFDDYSLTHSDKFSFNVGQWTADMDKVHSEWCREHFINPSSVKSITNFIETTMATLYRVDVDPEWLRCQSLEPIWNRDHSIQVGLDTFSSLYGEVHGKEMSTTTLVQLQSQAVVTGGSQDKTTTEYACIHFLNGNCRFGDDCTNLHSYSAPRPPCRFHLRGGCTNNRCLYAHNNEEPATISVSDSSMVTPNHGKYHGGALGWLKKESSSLLVLGGGLEQSLQLLRAPPKIALGGAPTDLVHFHTNRYLHNRGISKCVWHFPASSSNATDKENECLLSGFFMAANIFFEPALKKTTSHVEVGIILQGNQFSKWNVLSSAQNAGFCFKWFEEFDSAMFPSYNPDIIYDAKFYVFRLKKNVLHALPRMMEIRHGTQYGIELEMSSPPHLSRAQIAQALHVKNVEESWSEAKRVSKNWKIVSDGSISCSPSEPNCNQFELVSPILRSENGLDSTAKILGRLSSLQGIKVNKSMGFHVHIDVAKYKISDLVKICQQYVKYEHAIDSMMPRSRRTGSMESNRFFRSNSNIARLAFSKDEAGLLSSLQMCRSYQDLANILNPYIPSMQDRRYFKLNLQNLVSSRQSTIEFRQHSSTYEIEKVDAWVRFVVRFCEGSVSSDLPTSFANSTQSIDEQFDDLFKNIIRDSVLYTFYKKRRHLLKVDHEGDGCCHGCVTGQLCSK